MGSGVLSRLPCVSLLFLRRKTRENALHGDLLGAAARREEILALRGRLCHLADAWATVFMLALKMYQLPLGRLIVAADAGSK